jgi:hypothetical protein
MERSAEPRQGKKLIAAARHWARSRTTKRDRAEAPLDEDDEAELLSQGLDIEQVKAITRRREPVDPPFEVWPENWEAVTAFQRLATQWVIEVGMGGAIYLGLNYASVRSVLDWLSADPRDLFERLQLMELVALPILNKPRADDGR